MTKPNDVIEALCNAGLWTIGSVLNYIIPFLESDPETAVEEDRIGKRRKKALRIDRDAEVFSVTLYEYVKGDDFMQCQFMVRKACVTLT